MSVSNTLTKAGAVLLILLAALAVFGLYVWQNQAYNKPNNNEDIVENIYDDERVDYPAGTLFLTLTPIGGGTNNHYYSISRNLLKEASIRLKSDKLVDSVNILPTVTDSRKEMVLTSIDPKTKERRIVIYSPSTGKEEVVKNLGVDGVTTGPARISPKGVRVLYVTPAERTDQPTAANSHTIHIMSKKNGVWFEEGVIKGVNPVWINGDAAFAYIKNDGFYIYNVPGKEDVKFYGYDKGSDSAFGSNSRLAYSPVTSKLAWAVPDIGKVYMFDITKQDNGETLTIEVAPNGSIDEHAFWIVFSPDGKYLAMQTVDWQELETDPKPRISIYDVASKTKAVEDISLKGFDQNAMFLTDWK